MKPQNEQTKQETGSEVANSVDDLVMRVLTVTAKYDDTDGLWWRTDGEYAPVTFLVNCNDLFFWACADSVAITADNIDEFEQVYKDAIQHCDDAECYSQLLFCCRVREMRPQKQYYEYIDKEMWELFDACGPERTDA